MLIIDAINIYVYGTSIHTHVLHICKSHNSLIPAASVLAPIKHQFVLLTTGLISKRASLWETGIDIKHQLCVRCHSCQV